MIDTKLTDAIIAEFPEGELSSDDIRRFLASGWVVLKHGYVRLTVDLDHPFDKTVQISWSTLGGVTLLKAEGFSDDLSDIIKIARSIEALLLEEA